MLKCRRGRVPVIGLTTPCRARSSNPRRARAGNAGQTSKTAHHRNQLETHRTMDGDPAERGVYARDALRPCERTWAASAFLLTVSCRTRRAPTQGRRKPFDLPRQDHRARYDGWTRRWPGGVGGWGGRGGGGGVGGAGVGGGGGWGGGGGGGGNPTGPKTPSAIVVAPVLTAGTIRRTIVLVSMFNNDRQSAGRARTTIVD